MVFSHRIRQPVHSAFLEPHHPAFWRYDLLQALQILHRAGFGGDPRTGRPRSLLAGLRREDGRWHAAAPWWRPPGATGTGGEAVDWGEDAHRMVTLGALLVGAGD